MNLLREIFGDRAEEALEEMQHMGLDLDQLAAESGMGNVPGMLEHVVTQLRALMEQSQGQDVNWALAHEVAKGVAIQGGDPMVTLALADEHRSSITQAELWLDAVTDFPPSTSPPRVWSHAEWIEATLPTWRHLAGPVAVSVSRALAGLIGREGVGENALLNQVSPTVCGMHMGQAAGALAREAFGGTDLGLLLTPEARVTLIPRSISEFSDGLGVPLDEVRTFIALRECAHVRLFLHAPWLAGQLHTSIERYAKGVTIDPEALDRVVREAGAGDPSNLQRALSRGIFASNHSDEQVATLESIETLLALIEGWVEEVADAAASPHLPHLRPIEEMIRRRRAAGGPAEHTFATLLGLDLRPRRLREASLLWETLAREVGPAGRDAVWAHPDLLPDARDLDNPTPWIASRVAGEGGDDVDRELRELLSRPTPEPKSGEDDPDDTSPPA
ncbi:MAG: zinc-dependent metalloprotease [Demequinaceae bacterium]|nr:zinc-dependent metalloprotease [Demequinaceae bacterium]